MQRSDVPVVLVIEPATGIQDHTMDLQRAGLQVIRLSATTATTSAVLAAAPALIVAPLETTYRTLDLIRQLRINDGIRAIPIIIYGVRLTAADIEAIALAGALFLQLEPHDGDKLVAAVRGTLAASSAAQRL
jgi:DNA-binding response OmpR family regulator